MANQSYCRFENTLNDLLDCYSHMTNHCSDDEKEKRIKLVQLCKDIADDFYESDFEE
jgi:hypothetical protein